MDKLLKFIGFLGFLLSAVALIIISFQYTKKESIAFIDINYVYENYQAKLERQTELDFIIAKQDSVLKTFELELTGLYDQYKLESSGSLEKEIILKEKNYQRVYDEFATIADEQRTRFIEEIMSQINERVNDYARENGYSLVLGANGSGSLMYAKDELNISEEVVNYLNKVYAGD